MPIIERTAEQHEIERIEELEDRGWLASREDSKVQAKHKHELELAKAKLAVPQRHKTIARIGIAIAKIPALVILAVMIPLLVLARRDVPEPLMNFLNL